MVLHESALMCAMGARKSVNLSSDRARVEENAFRENLFTCSSDIYLSVCTHRVWAPVVHDVHAHDPLTTYSLRTTSQVQLPCGDTRTPHLNEIIARAFDRGGA
jgi:hypothetical protein